MTCNWNSLTLGDIANPDDGFIDGPFGSNLPANKYTEYGVPIIRGSNLNVGISSLKDNNYVFICEDDATRLKRSECLVGDIIFTKKGTLGQTGFITDKLKFNRFILSSNQMRLRVDTTKAIPEFVYYCLSSRLSISKVKTDSEHTGVPKINLKYLRQFPINLPSLEQQEAIVLIIKSLNDKLYLNTQANQTLEAMAQALFKSWFVDFDPVKAKMRGEQPVGMDAGSLPKEIAALFPNKLVASELGLIPEDWQPSTIGEEVEVVGGGTPSKKNPDFWNEGHIHWTSPKDLSGVQDKILLDTASKLTTQGLKKVSSGLLPVDTVLLSSRAPVGYLALAKVPMAINQGYIAMKCTKRLPPEYVLQWCVHNMDEIHQRASGSTFAEISKKSFKPIAAIVPEEAILDAYQCQVNSLYDLIESNVRENNRLKELSETLLPKLLSGELDL